MNFKLVAKAAAEVRADCLIVAAARDGTSKRRAKRALVLGAAAESVDRASGGALARRLAALNFDAAVGSTAVVDELADVRSPTLLVVGTGTAGKSLSSRDFRRVASAAFNAARKLKVERLASTLAEVEVSGRDAAARIRMLAEDAVTAAYHYSETRDKAAPHAPRHVDICLDGGARKSVAQAALNEGIAIGDATNVARGLGDLPANICTPRYLARHAQGLARRHKSLTARVLTERSLEQLGMQVMLSVAQGSAEPPRLIAVEYQGAKKKSAAPAVLVGKGVTFDTGGISIKPAASMDEMKFDMCGAASVLAAIEAVAELSLPINVVALVAATENHISGKATKPGDVFKSLSGKTVEVLNTDAEGRLILCDTLTYAARYKPDVVIDVATLTGACVVALGAHATGLFSNNQPLADALLDAGQRSDDRAWQLPIWDEYGKAMDSNFADIANVGGRAAGAITAAWFLSRFAEDYAWAHLDIAGTAWNSGKHKGATGRPVPLLVEYLLRRARG